jgi:hypothetical protein
MSFGDMFGGSNGGATIVPEAVLRVAFRLWNLSPHEVRVEGDTRTGGELVWKVTDDMEPIYGWRDVGSWMIRAGKEEKHGTFVFQPVGPSGIWLFRDWKTGRDYYTREPNRRFYGG